MIFCNEVLHWIPEQEKALCALRECCNEGAELHLLMRATIKGGNKHSEALLATMHSEKWHFHFKNYKTESIEYTHSKESLEELLKSTGFKDIMIWEVPRVRRFNALGDFETWVLGFIGGFAGVGDLSENACREFVHDWAERFIELTNQTNQTGVVSTGISLVARATA